MPKTISKPFEHMAKFGQFKFGEHTFGKSQKNAVVGHQKASSKFPSSWISTTPIFENAKIYATHGSKYQFGYVFKIDTERLKSAGVSAYIVSEFTAKPEIPIDKEIILVGRDFGVLPQDIVLEIIKVK